MPLKITNRQARRLWLDRQGLATAPTGPLSLDGVADIIARLGFVQLDTIRVIARAHDHILWSRNNNYREPMLDALMKTRSVFEHFTHDASVLPIETYPYWRRRFDRLRHEVEKTRWAKILPPPRERRKILDRIAREGALSTRDFQTQGASRPKDMWARPPHKYVLDYYWYAGVLATCHRKNFIKHYDLSERVIPETVRARALSDEAQRDWLCEAALARLGFATGGDIQRFWDATPTEEVKRWAETSSSSRVDVEVETAEGAWTRAFAPADIESALGNLKPATSRLRILNPFDPVARDRKRLASLFGFDYRIEIFTPAEKRQYGYYIYPMLEGERFVGRIEAKASLQAGVLTIDNVWWEPSVRQTPARLNKLNAELDRMARFVGLADVEWRCDPALGGA